MSKLRQAGQILSCQDTEARYKRPTNKSMKTVVKDCVDCNALSPEPLTQASYVPK